MTLKRSVATVRSLTLLNTLLMTTAFTVPAFAQIETVVVTAERKAEDIQTVPIAVTALTSHDLKAKQITNFRDLQFHVPSVTYTKSNFGGAQFQIRGITTQFGLGAAIAQNIDEIYLEAPNLVTGEYYDVDRVEVSRGPQSTIYGRAATGGAVDIVTAKPDLDEFKAYANFDYGSFSTYKPDAMVNIPIIDGELGARFAIHGDFNDGYEKNIYTGPQIYPGSPVKNRINNLGILEGRASVRWEPNSDTTIDLVADVGYENDRRVRGDKQECHRDPSGVVGCLPDRLGFDPINTASTLGVTLGSAQGLTGLLSPSLPFVAAQTIGNTVGLGSVAGNCGPGDTTNTLPTPLCEFAFLGAKEVPAGPAPALAIVPQTPAAVNGPGTNPNAVVTPDILTANTAFNPKYKTAGGTYILNWQQKITDWLSATLDAGYANGYQFTQQNYTGSAPENDQAVIQGAQTGFDITFGGKGYLGLAPGLIATNANAYDAVLFNVPGSLPISNVNYLGPRFGNYGGEIDYTRGGILTKSPFGTAYDEDWYGSRESTGELRFQTNFDFPVNFSAGAFYMTFDSHNQYWVASNGLDWDSAVLGAFLTPCTGGVCSTTPYMVAMPSFDAEYQRLNIVSRSAFLEATWDIIPDEFKAIVGGRYNDDREHLLRTPSCVGGGLLTDNFNPAAFGGVASPISCAYAPGIGLYPLGATNVSLPVNANLPGPLVITGANPAKRVSVTDQWTGRVSLNWTPKLDWTTQTLVYLTASRGELASGINVVNNGAQPIGNTYPGGIPVSFKPATVDALELGTKNTLLDDTLTANLDVWYYNYENYQVGIIANRQALTLNVPARLYGFEGEFLWSPTEELAFNFTLSLTQSESGHAFLPDQRNLTNNVPGSILVKDLDNGSDCVVIPTPGGPRTNGQTPGDSNLGYHVNNFYLPNGGNAAIDAPFGIPLVNYGLCAPAGATDTARVTARNALNAAGFSYSQDVNPLTGAPVTGGFNNGANGSGFVRDLHGNKLPQVPFGQVGVGGQYTWKAGDGYTIVPRVDYYWQSSMESRLWNDPNIDRVSAWDTMNLQVQLNAPDQKWHVQVFAKNVFDKHNPTGIYLTDPTSALFTNVFAEDPRVIGVELGAAW